MNSLNYNHCHHRSERSSKLEEVEEKLKQLASRSKWKKYSTAGAELSMIYDTTGMFHWVPTKPIEDCTYDRDQAESIILNGHVVVCLFANPDSPLISLRNFVMPLRASNIHYDELKHVIIVG